MRANINLQNVDCMRFMRDVPDNYYELAIVDLEYNIGASRPSKKPNIVKQKNGNNLFVNPNKYTPKDWDFKLSTPAYFNLLFLKSKKQIIWGGNYYGLRGGYLVWDKLNGNCDQFDCEMAWVSGSKRLDLVYFLWSGMFQGSYCGRDIRKALVQQGDKRLNEKRIHPTQKPVALYKWLLKNYANEGDKILDTHGGSMSIAIACWDMGFDLDLCELDEDYYKAGVERFNNHKAQLQLF